LPGGDLLALTNGTPPQVLVCVCGHPVRLGAMRSRVPQEYESFERSFQAAVAYRDRAHPDAIVAALAAVFANKEQLALVERVAQMQTTVNEIPRPNARGPRHKRLLLNRTANSPSPSALRGWL
jgi:hypothetical protein